MKTFAELAVGDRFQIGTPRGLIATKFIKTSDTGYGLSRGMELWGVKDMTLPCEPLMTGVSKSAKKASSPTV